VPLSAENTAVVVDSTADLPDPQARQPNWRLVPLYVRFGAETFREYVDISADEFYRRLRESREAPKSSQPSPADFQQVFESLSDYEHILCVVLSSKISGTHDSARLAAESMGDGRVRVLDSRVTSGGTVILADAIQRRLERGVDEGEIDALVERFRRERGLLFTVDTLEYLIRGGRIGKAAGLAGQLLSVKPILAFEDGEVAPLKKVRGRGKAIAELEAIFEEESRDGAGLHIGVGHAAAPADCEELRRRVQEARPQASLDGVFELGPVIGTHGGPGTLGLFWFHDET
jgi:DegV family protein with EDD domain